jgi:hypothetical protein
MYINKTKKGNNEYEYEITSKSPGLRPTWYLLPEIWENSTQNYGTSTSKNPERSFSTCKVLSGLPESKRDAQSRASLRQTMRRI